VKLSYSTRIKSE